MDDYEREVPVTRESFNAENDIAIFMGPITSMYRRISVEELKDLIKRGGRLDIIDVRATAEYRLGHICGSADVPVDAIEETFQSVDPERLIVVYGASRSAEDAVAADKLHTLSFHNVLLLDGGIWAWRKAGGCLELEANPIRH